MNINIRTPPTFNNTLPSDPPSYSSEIRVVHHPIIVPYQFLYDFCSLFGPRSQNFASLPLTIFQSLSSSWSASIDTMHPSLVLLPSLIPLLPGNEIGVSEEVPRVFTRSCCLKLTDSFSIRWVTELFVCLFFFVIYFRLLYWLKNVELSADFCFLFRYNKTTSDEKLKLFQSDFHELPASNVYMMLRKKL